MNLRLATLQRLLVLVVIGLAIFYVAVLRPLSQQVVREDGPMADRREQLARATIEAGLPRGTSFEVLSNRLQVLRSSSAAFTAALRESEPRLSHPPEVRARLEEPFQLVEFLNESQRRLEELSAMAQGAKVKLTPGLPRGFPRYQPELARPELLWVQLAMVNRVVRTAIRTGVEEVREVSVEPLPFQETAEYGPVPPSALPAPPRATGPWSVLRMHLTAVGTVDALGRMLLALTLTPEDSKSAGFPEDWVDRPALFLDHLLMRRHQLEAAEKVQIELVVSTVVADDPP